MTHTWEKDTGALNTSLKLNTMPLPSTRVNASLALSPTNTKSNGGLLWPNTNVGSIVADERFTSFTTLLFTPPHNPRSELNGSSIVFPTTAPSSPVPAGADGASSKMLKNSDTVVANGFACSLSPCTVLSFAAATIFIAFVIFPMLWIDFILSLIAERFACRGCCAAADPDGSAPSAGDSVIAEEPTGARAEAGSATPEMMRSFVKARREVEERDMAR
mmetsp:Transcript_24739/g.61850  ORF Transcript_24739/g.61850 Transcript_24739/m.61850 type:complete len:218 (+) Transcript_24739:702-1355(+)